MLVRRLLLFAIVLFAAVLAASLFGGGAQAQAVPATALLKSPHSVLCAEFATTAPGAQARQSACADAPRQQWDLRAVAGGHEIVNRASGMCLTVDGGSMADGAAAVQSACAGASHQRWIIRPSAAAFEIVAAHSGQCLEIWDWSKAEGALLNQWRCYDAPNQKWTLAPTVATPGVPSSAMIVGMTSGKCLDMANGSRLSGAQAQIWDCTGAAWQEWRLRPAMTGGHQVVNADSGLCLGVADGATADGATVVQRPCGPAADAAASERWSVRPKSGYVELVAAHSGKCLTVIGGATGNGAGLRQWACNKRDRQSWTLSTELAPSVWSAKVTLPIVPVAAATLRNGKILTWSAFERLTYGGDNGRTYTTIYDPATNTASERLVSNTGHDMFCPGTAMLPDGRILVNGGASSAKTSIYDPVSNAWTSGAAMNVPRGYQGDTVLSTGEVLTVGGSWSGDLGGKTGEVWSPSGGWRRLPGVVGETLSAADPAGIYRGDNHMWLFAAADGSAFHAGPSARMNWISTAGDGAVSSAGLRGDDAYAMNGNIVMYDAGRLLKVGGAPGYDKVQATGAAYTIDFGRGPLKPVRVAKQKPMAFPRAFSNAVALPNGQVVVIGGQSHPETFADSDSIFYPEIWTPATGAFTRLARMSTPRNYHSVATLMLDGRVFVGGGGLCGVCSTNHADAEILTPPYLLNSDGSAAARPVIQSAPPTAAPKALISVTTDRPAASFALVRLGAVTHSVNNDQRRISLPIQSLNGSTYGLRLPGDRAILLAGDWMLFAMDAGGVPSVASIVRVQ